MKPDEERKKQADIISEATRLFLYKGYHATSMDEISRAVNLSKGSIYHCFDSKEDILRMAINTSASACLALLREVAVSDLPPVEKLRQAVHVHVQIIHDYPVTFLAVRENFDLLDSRLRDEVLALITSYDNLLDQIVNAGVEHGQLRADLNPRLISYAMLGMCNWMFESHKKDVSLSPSEIADQFFQLLTGGVLASDHSHSEDFKTLSHRG
ncbi:MAG: TetR/AcrR family transcriptional regulator [Dehalococcoidia bacterium]|nr:TetR/AcrR family transcriptional regulator [Dehalococcoidia bacterium]